MLGVQTLKVLTAVVVSGALRGMAKTAQVKIESIRNISGKGKLRAVHGILNWSSVIRSVTKRQPELILTKYMSRVRQQMWK